MGSVCYRVWDTPRPPSSLLSPHAGAWRTPNPNPGTEMSTPPADTPSGREEPGLPQKEPKPSLAYLMPKEGIFKVLPRSTHSDTPASLQRYPPVRLP